MLNYFIIKDLVELATLEIFLSSKVQKIQTILTINNLLRCIVGILGRQSISESIETIRLWPDCPSGTPLVAPQHQQQQQQQL